MNREIKFRAWNLKDYGNKKDDFYVSANTMVTWEEIQGDKNKWLDSEHFGKNFILLQFTELYDKQGKEIYEGDVVRYGHSNGFASGTRYFKGIIEFKNCSFGIKIKEEFEPITNDNVDKLEKADTFEVIGNIYEHDYLLK